MSRSLARLVATLSYGETHDPEVAAQLLPVTTLVPSRFKTARMNGTEGRQNIASVSSVSQSRRDRNTKHNNDRRKSLNDFRTKTQLMNELGEMGFVLV